MIFKSDCKSPKGVLCMITGYLEWLIDQGLDG